MTRTSHGRDVAVVGASPGPARLAVWALLVVVTVGAVACASTPTRRYYTLSYPLERDPATESRPPLHPVQLRVRPFRGGLPYDRPQIVYRQSPYEFQYYVYQLWAAKPHRMLRELVQSHLESTRLVAEVTRDYGERLPDYELVAEVLAVEEYDSGPVWYGHLAMRFELVRFSDKMPLWNYHFDRKRKVFEKQPVYVVRTLSEILADEMARVTAELDRVISADRGVAPTLALPPPPVDDEAPRKATRIRTTPRRRDAPESLSDPVTQPDSQELIVPEDEEALPLILPEPEPGR